MVRKGRGCEGTVRRGRGCEGEGAVRRQPHLGLGWVKASGRGGATHAHIRRLLLHKFNFHTFDYFSIEHLWRVFDALFGGFLCEEE